MPLKRSSNIDSKKKCAYLTLKWCKEHMGINNRRKTKPKVSVRIYFKKDETERFIKGAYYSDENRIIIYEINCKTLENVVSTVIHEYTHYMQSTKKYWDFFKTHDYSTHPYERQAKRNEKKYTKICLSEILNILD